MTFEATSTMPRDIGHAPSRASLIRQAARLLDQARSGLASAAVEENEWAEQRDELFGRIDSLLPRLHAASTGLAYEQDA